MASMEDEQPLITTPEEPERLVIPPLKPTHIALRVIARIIFPPLLIVDLIGLILKRTLSDFVKNQVIGNKDFDEKSSARTYSSELMTIEDDSDLKKIVRERSPVSIDDGVTIDTMKFRFKQTLFIKHSGVHIIHCNGNGENWESCAKDHAQLAHDLRCTVIGFNYRGIGASQGQANGFRDIVNDAIAVAQDLIDQGVDPKNIVLQGTSLGGMVAAYVNKQLCSVSDDQSFYVHTDRSPASLTKFVISYVRRAAQFPKLSELRYHLSDPTAEEKLVNSIDGYSETPLWKFVGTLLYPFVKFALYATGWTGNAAKALKETPFNFRANTVVKSTKEARENQENPPKDDFVVSDYSSIHQAFKRERRAFKYGNLERYYPDHTDTDLQDIRAAHTAIRKASRYSAQEGGHWCDKKDLRSKPFSQQNLTVNSEQHLKCFIRATHYESYNSRKELNKLDDGETALQEAFVTAGF